MHWQEVLMIITPLMGMMGWVYGKIDKRFEKIDQKFEKIDQKFEKIDQKFEQIEHRLSKIENRLCSLEGRFDERGYWESREWPMRIKEEK